MKSYNVIDDHLDQDYFEHIQNELNKAWWSLQEEVAYHGDPDSIDEAFYFVHPIFENNSPKSDMHKVLEQFYHSIGVKAIIRTRAIMYMNQGKQIVHSPHVDMHYSHNAALFYMNDNDGFTLMADEDVEINAKQDEDFKSPIEFSRKGGGDIFEQQNMVVSKRNRLCVHDGSRPHCSSTPTNTKKRVLIAVNYF